MCYPGLYSESRNMAMQGLVHFPLMLTVPRSIPDSDGFNFCDWTCSMDIICRDNGEKICTALWNKTYIGGPCAGIFPLWSLKDPAVVTWLLFRFSSSICGQCPPAKMVRWWPRAVKQNGGGGVRGGRVGDGRREERKKGEYLCQD